VLLGRGSVSRGRRLIDGTVTVGNGVGKLDGTYVTQTGHRKFCSGSGTCCPRGMCIAVSIRSCAGFQHASALKTSQNPVRYRESWRAGPNGAGSQIGSARLLGRSGRLPVALVAIATLLALHPYSGGRRGQGQKQSVKIFELWRDAAERDSRSETVQTDGRGFQAFVMLDDSGSV
jgi:hypothetical protein